MEAEEGVAARMVIRDAEPADAAALVALLEHGALEPGKEDAGDLAPYAEALARSRAAQTTACWSPTSGSSVGMCQLIVFRHLQHHGGRCAEIESMHVHPDYRSGGIGALLVEAAVGAAREAGCYRIQLTSNVERTDAHRFYERLGFVPSHRGSSCCWSRLQIERALLGEVVPVGRSCEGNHRVSNQSALGNVSRAVHQRHIWPCG